MYRIKRTARSYPRRSGSRVVGTYRQVPCYYLFNNLCVRPRVVRARGGWARWGYAYATCVAGWRLIRLQIQYSQVVACGGLFPDPSSSMSAAYLLALQLYTLIILIGNSSLNY